MVVYCGASVCSVLESATELSQHTYVSTQTSSVGFIAGQCCIAFLHTGVSIFLATPSALLCIKKNKKHSDLIGPLNLYLRYLSISHMVLCVNVTLLAVCVQLWQPVLR